MLPETRNPKRNREEEVKNDANLENKKKKISSFVVYLPESDEDRNIVLSLLNGYSAECFAVPYPNTLVLDCKMLLPDALRSLTESNLHWAPVKDSQYIIGMIDLRMMVSFVVRTFKQNSRLFEEEVLQEVSCEEKWHTTTVKQVMKSFSSEKRNGNIVLEASTPILHAIKLMTYGQHRFCVTKNKQFFGVLSQFDIVKFLSLHLDKCGPIVSKSIEELNCGLRLVVAETNDVKMIDILQDIERWNIGGLAVIGKNNVLVGNLSVSDLKLIVKDDPLSFACLNITLKEFLKRVRTEFPTNLGTVVACPDYDTIGNVMRILSANHLHRIYVVDENGTLTGVITCNNVLETLVPYESDRGSTSPINNHQTSEFYS